MMGGRSTIVWMAITSASLFAVPDYRHSGDDHFFNLEFDQAIGDYTKLIEQNPADPIPYSDLATAQLYKEMYRLGLLDSTALMHDDRFVRDRHAQVDPMATQQVLDTLERSRRSAEKVLVRDPHNALALYSLCTDYALLGTYEFMLEKAWFAALRNGSRAQGYCEQARKADPQFIDAYLVLGVYQYATAGLPLPVKLFAAIGGLHGSKKKGIEYVSRVAQEGKYSRDAARVLLVVLYSREKRPLEAAGILEGLIADHPRNYLFGLELASVYSEAGESDRALSVLKNLLEKADQNAAGYRRLPRPAVQRQMEILEARLSVRRNSGT